MRSSSRFRCQCGGCSSHPRASFRHNPGCRRHRCPWAGGFPALRWRHNAVRCSRCARRFLLPGRYQLYSGIALRPPVRNCLRGRAASCSSSSNFQEVPFDMAAPRLARSHGCHRMCHQYTHRRWSLAANAPPGPLTARLRRTASKRCSRNPSADIDPAQEPSCQTGCSRTPSCRPTP